MTPTTDPPPPAPETRAPRARTRRAVGSSAVRVAVLVGAYLLVALAGGVLAASVAPVSVDNADYAAQVRLSPAWADRSQVRTESVIGGVRVDFAGFAPGVEVQPRVQPQLAQQVAQEGLDPQELVPTRTERDQLLADAATGLAGRVATGALLGVGAVVAVVSLARRRPPGVRGLTGAGLTAGAASLLLVGAAAGTYAPDRVQGWHASGLVEVAVANKSLMGDVAERADKATPYLRNLIALSEAMHREYTPTSIADTAAVRVLLVSDIHSANHYALLRTIVAEQDIDVVIDSGDLINLGRAPEARLSRLHEGIASLGVPYVFVAGNHDRARPGDLAVLNELDRVESVVLLEPGNGRYQQVTVKGITIAGFNDPSFYGAGRDGNPARQRAARQRWVAALGDGPVPDVTVTHQPAALDGAPGRVRINGHLHEPRIEGNRVQVGSFTGRGTLSHFRGEDMDSLVGHPNTFDVLTFGRDCQAQRLTRYQYRAVLEGRPTYDSLSVLNAARVVEKVQGAARTCGGDGVTITELGAGARVVAGPQGVAR